MQALLLAAGLGTRLRPLTDVTPKCLVPIHGRPLLAYWIDMLVAADIERIIINTHWLAEKVRDFAAASPWRDRIVLVHEDELLGTGGTVRRAASFFENRDVLVAHADNLTDFDISGLIRAHAARPAHCAMTMLTFRTDDPRSCGIVELDQSNVVQAFHEKVADPPGNLANAAVYVFTPEITKYVQALPSQFVDLSVEVMPKFVGRIFAVETGRYHRDIGNIESLRRAEKEYNPGGRILQFRE